MVHTLLPSSQSDTNWGPLSIIINRDKDLPPILFKVLENTLPPSSKGDELWDPLWEDHLEEELWIYPPHTIWNTPLRVFIEMKTETPPIQPQGKKNYGSDSPIHYLGVMEHALLPNSKRWKSRLSPLTSCKGYQVPCFTKTLDCLMISPIIALIID